jgi:hypothetical protein
MPIKPRGKFYHPDFYEDLPDGVFDDTPSGINMEGLCNFADEEDVGAMDDDVSADGETVPCE